MNLQAYKRRQFAAFNAKHNAQGDSAATVTDADPLGEAITRLFNDIAAGQRNRKASLTNAGKPDCRVLSEMLGRDVSARERDDAWKHHHENEGTK